MRSASGVTLVELVVSMLVLSLLSGVAGALFLAHTRPPLVTPADSLGMEAVRSGRAITDERGRATYLPDGRVIGRASVPASDSAPWEPAGRRSAPSPEDPSGGAR